MTSDPHANERRYFDALRQITAYDSPERIERTAERDWGLEPHEALQMAYDNIQGEARAALHGKRRPKPPGSQS